MRDSRKRDAAVEDKLIALACQQFIQLRACRGLVPTFAKQRAAVAERFVHIGVSRDDGVAKERHVWCRAHLREEHEQLAEPRQMGASPGVAYLRYPIATRYADMDE